MSNNERGFTLVEAIVAMMVCTVGLVAMAELLAVTLRLQQLGRNSTSASRMAQDKLDDFTSMSFGDAELACGGDLDADDADHFDTPAGVPNYKRRWVVSAGPDGDGNLREITVRVIPDVNDRRTASPFDLTTIIRNGDNLAPPAVCP